MMRTEEQYAARVAGGIREAERCLQCHDAPCTKGCPAGVDVKRFVGLLQKGDCAAAAAAIERDNPLGLICGYVCPSAETCQKNCVSAALGRPIDIRALQACAITRGRMHPASYQAATACGGELRFLREGAVETVSYLPDGQGAVAVVGGGPAGLSAAWYLKQFGYRVSIYEASDRLGGRLTGGIPAFRLSPELVQGEIHRLTEDIAVHTGVRLGRDLTVRKLFQRGYRGVILALGKMRCRALPIEGAEAVDVYTADQILTGSEWCGEGHERAVVIGGGNVAMDTARVLLRRGVGQVTICYRGGSLQVQALPEEREEAFQEGIALQLCAVPLAVQQENGRVTGVRFRRAAPERTPAGGTAPAPLRETYDFTVPADMLVFAVGYALEEADLLESGIAVSGGQIAIKERYRADVAGVFAAGDAAGGRTVVEAAGGGKAAAYALHTYLREEGRGYERSVH